MMRRREIGKLLTVVFLALLLSCTTAKTPPDVTSTAVPPAKPAPPVPQSSDRIVAVARGHVTTGDYQKAIDIYRAACEKAPRDDRLTDAYRESIETMASLADTALARQDIGAAGETYAILLKNYPYFEGFAQQLSFDRASLRYKLEDCKETLFNRGFQEYRRGNLGRAIALWQDLLVIDPENADIQEALRTARLQQKTLRDAE